MGEDLYIKDPVPDKDDEHDDSELHQNALMEFDRIYGALREERLQCVEDRRFYSIAGAQWEGPLESQFENKPKLEINKVHLSVIRIFNEYRNNRIDLSFVSRSGDQGDDLADACNDLYRADEKDSCAEEAFDNAFEEAVGGGIGAFRLRTCYENEEDPEDERQRIKIEPIFDADSSVYFDLDAKRQDKSDAVHCFVISSMTVQAYEDEYDDSPASWPKDLFNMQFDWCTPDVVYIAEYYRVEKGTTKVYTYKLVDGTEEKYEESDFENDEELKKMLKATGAKRIKTRTINRRRVHKWIMSGGGILEDCGELAGCHIPIIPVYGKRWFVDNVERCMGHVRLAKDSQRLANMQRSKLAELSALSSVRKPIVTPEQIGQHKQMWSDDNIKNYPYLLLNSIMDVNGNMTPTPPIAYTESPDVPQPLAALLQITDQDLEQLLGNQQAGEEIQPNISGKAIELVQNRLDMQSFIYMSNMAKSIRRCGEVWLSIAKEIYTEVGRKMKGISKHGDPVKIQIMKPNMKNGEMVYENDLSNANYDVDVIVGPSSVSKRDATVRALTSMMTLTQDPETLQVLSSMAIMNMEGEGIDDVRDYFRKKLLRMGALKPTDEEAKELAAEAQNAPPDPNAQYLQAAAAQAEAEANRAQVESGLKLSQIDKTRAEVEKVQAETLKTMSEIGNEARRVALDSANTLSAMDQQQEDQRLARENQGMAKEDQAMRQQQQAHQQEMDVSAMKQASKDGGE